LVANNIDTDADDMIHFSTLFGCKRPLYIEQYDD